MLKTNRTNRFYFRLAFLVSLCMALFLQNAFGQLITLKGDPEDYDFESNKVCCIDVAAVNLLKYLDRQDGNERLIPDQTSIKEQQEYFHKKYDPTFGKTNATIYDLKKGLDATFKDRGFTAEVKNFYTKDLSYKTLLSEWVANELIILIAQEVDRKWGHALFLWGLEKDANTPRLSVVDPNIHPNTDHKLDGKNTKSKGIATWSDLSIKNDMNNFPEWEITLIAREHTYTLDNITETFDNSTYKYRITGFASVSDVKEIPEPKTLTMLGFGLLGIVIIRRNKTSSIQPKRGFKRDHLTASDLNGP